MKKRLHIIILIFTIFSFNIYAQWFQQTSPTTSTLNSIYFIDDSVGWCVGNQGTIIHTTNGGEIWSSQTSGTTEDLLEVYFVNSLIGFTVGGYSSPIILKTTNGGNDWGALSIPSYNQLTSVFFVTETTGWVVDRSGRVYKTTNGGIDWVMTQLYSGTQYNILNSIFFISDSIGWTAGYGGAVHRTTDAGANWVRSTTSPEQWLQSVYFVSETTGWVVGDSPASAPTKISKTVDGGNTWTHYDTDIGALFSVFFTSDSIGWVVGTDGTILNTTDGGNNWNLQSSGVEAWLVSVFFVDSLTGWVVGGVGTILKTITGGIVPVELISLTGLSNENNVILNWSTATETNNHGFEIQRKTESTNWITIGFKEGKGTTTEPQTYSFTDKELQPGKYSYRLKQVDFDGTYKYSDIVDVDVEAVPLSFSLSQNYPNPFNPTTNIKYQIPNSEFVTLKVYDVLGNEVATLVNEEKPAGNYTVEFNVGQDSSPNLASGAYFYQLTAGSYTETKKLILLK